MFLNKSTPSGGKHSPSLSLSVLVFLESSIVDEI